ncbi:MAG: hypothetical protein H8D23_09580 [Candidatus Brocadiales bacterium]|nr:hypothetical protein [Candidatus Brocadiales bacterium]
MAKGKRAIAKQEEEKRLVLHTICMRMSEREALVYLQTRNHKMGVNKYYNLKEEIKTAKVKTLQDIALHDGLIEQHLDRIHNLEVIEHELWLTFNQEPDNYKRANILTKIAEMQPYISGAYDMTRVIMEKQVELKTGYEMPEIRK